MKALLLGSLEVLTDTSHLWRSASRKAFSDHGIDFAPRAGDAPPGRLCQQFGDCTPVPVADIIGSRDLRYADALALGPLRPRPGLARLLDAVQVRGIALGLITEAPRDWTISVFEGLDLDPERFDAIVTDDFLTSRKPAPDGYHLASAMMGTAPEDCVSVETSRAGLRAARSLGMRAIDAVGPRADPVAAALAVLPAPRAGTADAVRPAALSSR